MLKEKYYILYYCNRRSASLSKKGQNLIFRVIFFIIFFLNPSDFIHKIISVLEHIVCSCHFLKICTNSWNTLLSKMMLNFWRLDPIFFTKYNNFIGACWFLTNNLSDFVSLPWKLNNPYCHRLLVSYLSVKVKFRSHVFHFLDGWSNQRRCVQIVDFVKIE